MIEHQSIIVPAIASTGFPLAAVLIRARARRVLLAAALTTAVAVSFHLAAVLRLATLSSPPLLGDRVAELLLSAVPLLMAGFVLSVTFGRERPQDSLRASMRVLVPLGLLGLLLLTLHDRASFIAEWDWATGRASIHLGTVGRLFTGYLLLGIVLIGDNLEKTYRAAGYARWGGRATLAGLFGVLGFFAAILAAGLISSSVRTGPLVAAGLPISGASLLIGCGCLRGVLSEPAAPHYPNGVRTSFTIVAAGLAVLAMTIAAEATAAVQGPPRLTLALSAALFAVLFTGVIMFSDLYQRRARRFFDLTLSPGRHDYRAHWARLTAELTSATNREVLLDRVSLYLRETFSADAVTISLRDEATDRLRPVRGKGAVEAAETIDSDTPLWQELLATREAMLLDGRPHDFTYIPIYAENQSWLEATASRLIAPLRDGERLAGAIGLERADARERLTYRDAALLESIAAHVTAALRGMRLAEELALTTEADAVSKWSGAILADLRKCLVPLEMVASDLAKSGHDPAIIDLCAGDLGGVAERLEVLSRTLAELRASSAPEMGILEPNEIVQEALAEMQTGRWPLLNLHLRLDARQAIRGDRAALQRVVRNLIANAIEAMEGTGDLRIATRDLHVDGALRVQIAVSDTGSGIRADFLREQLFRPFVTTKKRHLGLGLWQCRMIVHAHGGEISVDSRRSQGTVFHVALAGVPPRMKRVAPSRQRKSVTGRVLDEILPGQ
jgi:putative PEP-CTERM system histidine kinase